MRAAIVKTDVPTLQEEIDRKAFETLEWLCYSVDQGRMTADQFSVGIDVLFMTVSGLLKKDFIDLITAAQEQCPKEPLVLKRVFAHKDDDRLVTAEWIVGQEDVAITFLKSGKRHDKTLDSTKKAQEFFSTAVPRALQANGYKEF
jgi:hypothetical protein